MHSDHRLPPDFPYDALIERARLQRAETMHHPLDALREFMHILAGAIGLWLQRTSTSMRSAAMRLASMRSASISAATTNAASDDAALAGASSYAELRRRFGALAVRHSAIPLDPGP